LLGQGERQSGRPAVAQNVPLTFLGNVQRQDISPDGKLLAYLERGDTFRLFVKDLVGGSVIPIAAIGTQDSPIRWSSHGSAILYIGQDSLGRGRLPFIVPRLGGSPRPLPARGFFSVLSPDGSRQAAWAQNPEDSISITTVATGEARLLSVPPSVGSLPLDGDWSPNGRMIALVSIDRARNLGQTMWLVDVESGRWHKAVSDTAVLYSPRWSPAGDVLYYLRSESSELRKIPIESDGSPSGASEVVQSRLGASDISISADGTKLTYTKSQGHSNLWVAAGTQRRTEFTKSQLTYGTAWTTRGRLSPDGSLIAFVQFEGDRGDLFVVPVGGGLPQQVTSSGVAVGEPAWSPDGKRLAFNSRMSEGNRLQTIGIVRTIGIDGRGERTFSRTESSFYLSWAPSTRILYRRPGNRNFHWLDAITEAEEPLVTNDSMGWMVFNPSPSPDGNFVAIHWNRPPNRRVYLISLKDASQIAIGPPSGIPLGWSADGASLYVQDLQRGIWRIPSDGGKGAVVGIIPFTHANPLNDAGCQLTEHSSDLVLVCSALESVSDVWMMENFDATANPVADTGGR
jgi:Tol biopolymer transport system component